jgi:HEAT repeat protein
MNGWQSIKLRTPITPIKTDNPDFTVRLAVCQALGAFRTHTDLTAPTLIRALQDTNEGTRMFAANSLGLIHALPEKSVPALIEALKDNSPSVRMMSVQALGKFR